MDIAKRPTSVMAVEAYLRSLVPPMVLANLTEGCSNEYPFLFGMATVKLAEANTEIARLENLVAAQQEELDHA